MQAILAIAVALLAAFGVLYCILKPKYAIIPVLMLFPVAQILEGYIPELRWQYNGVINIVVGLIAVFGAANYFFRSQRPFEGVFNKEFFLIMTFYAYMMISLLWTPAGDSAAYFLAKTWPYFFLFFCVSPLLIRGLDDLVSLNVPMMVVGIALMALMLVNPEAKFINDRFVIDLGYQPGFGQISSNPLAIADAGAILAITAALYRQNNWSVLLTLLKWSGVMLGLTLALLSGSRGQVLGALAVIGIMLPFASGTRNPIRAAGSVVALGVVAVFLYMIFNTFVISTAQNRWNGTGDLGVSGRMEMIKEIMTGYGENPAFWFTGLGGAAFNAFTSFRTATLPHTYPHNILVESLTEYGVIGLVLMVAITYFSMKNAIRLIKLAGDDRSRRTTASIYMGFLLFQFLINMKQGYLLGMPPLFMFCLIIARVVKNEEAALAAGNAELNGEYGDDYGYANDYGDEPAADYEGGAYAKAE